MDPDFHFDAVSSDEETVAGEEGPKKQSPWEFSSYSESVADEYVRRRTTSVDAKISRALQQRPFSLPDHEDDDEEEEVEEEEVLSADESTKKVSSSFSSRPGPFLIS